MNIEELYFSSSDEDEAVIINVEILKHVKNNHKGLKKYFRIWLEQKNQLEGTQYKSILLNKYNPNYFVEQKRLLNNNIKQFTNSFNQRIKNKGKYKRLSIKTVKISNQDNSHQDI